MVQGVDSDADIFQVFKLWTAIEEKRKKLLEIAQQLNDIGVRCNNYTNG